MKVKCINKDGWACEIKLLWRLIKYLKGPAFGPKYGDIITVVKEEWDKGAQYYEFKEWPRDLFAAGQFVPLQESSIQQVAFTTIKESNPISVN